MEIFPIFAWTIEYSVNCSGLLKICASITVLTVQGVSGIKWSIHHHQFFSVFQTAKIKSSLIFHQNQFIINYMECALRERDLASHKQHHPTGLHRHKVIERVKRSQTRFLQVAESQKSLRTWGSGFRVKRGKAEPTFGSV